MFVSRLAFHTQPGKKPLKASFGRLRNGSIKPAVLGQG